MQLRELDLEPRVFYYFEPQEGPFTKHKRGFRLTYEEVICLGDRAPPHQMSFANAHEDICSNRSYHTPLELYAGIAVAQDRLDKSWWLKARVLLHRMCSADSYGPQSLITVLLTSVVVGAIASLFIIGVSGLIIQLLGG